MLKRGITKKIPYDGKNLMQKTGEKGNYKEL